MATETAAKVDLRWSRLLRKDRIFREAQYAVPQLL